MPCVALLVVSLSLPLKWPEEVRALVSPELPTYTFTTAVDVILGNSNASSVHVILWYFNNMTILKVVWNKYSILLLSNS